jgi:hypothetical protein
MVEGRRHFLVARRQRDPTLQSVQMFAAGTMIGARALGMRDAAARRHPVHVAGHDRHRAAEAVAMHDLAFEEIGDGGKPDVRVRAHVNALARAELRRSHVIEKDEGPDHAAAGRGQRAPNGKAAKVGGARHDHEFNCIARKRIAGLRVLGGEPTHPALRGFLTVIGAPYPSP